VTRCADLAGWLAWLDTEDCTCPYEWRSLGKLYGVSMGKGWVRMSTDAACRHHPGETVPVPPAGEA
jgi:hypothetical protein